MTRLDHQRPKPRLSAIPALLIATGLGLVFHFGHAWYRLPRYSAAEIEQSIEINLAIEQQSAGKQLDEAALQQRRMVIDDELKAEIARERREVMGYTATGILLLLISSIHLWLMRRWASR